MEGHLILILHIFHVYFLLHESKYAREIDCRTKLTNFNVMGRYEEISQLSISLKFQLRNHRFSLPNFQLGSLSSLRHSKLCLILTVFHLIYLFIFLNKAGGISQSWFENFMT